MLRFAFLIAWVFMTLALPVAPARAQSAQPPNPCPLVKPAQINVVPATQKVKYDYSKTLAQLQQTEVDTINPYGFSGVTSVNAYMKGTVAIKPQVRIGSQTNTRLRASCLWYDSIDVRIEIAPTIVIGKEIYYDPCLKRVTLDHEMKHVNVDRQIVNKYAKIIGQKIYSAIEARGFRTPPVPSEHVPAMNDRMSKVIAQVVELEHNKMQLERMEAQQAIDSLEEYERINKLCESSRANLPDMSARQPKPQSKSRKKYR